MSETFFEMERKTWKGRDFSQILKENFSMNSENFSGHQYTKYLFQNKNRPISSTFSSDKKIFLEGLFLDFLDHIKNVTDVIFCKLKKAQKTWNYRSHFSCGQENLRKAPPPKNFFVTRKCWGKQSRMMNLCPPMFVLTLG